jgi:Taurine catabolism dioxygenase TauD, TfdA family
MPQLACRSCHRPPQRPACSLSRRVLRCPIVVLQYKLQPGDVQLLNNHVSLHTRDAWEDWPVSVWVRAGQATVLLAWGQGQC